eukprot:TRINITY_DN9184_c0_g1_i1.p2 TRINITY_DN9184_c0_g1~~TRINITY_DN9184_c0_g1_i1.p2  ORF type:complete len:168 (-),score=19.46 TRINITY_DN9184_c0_g1_i1:3-506(-)
MPNLTRRRCASPPLVTECEEVASVLGAAKCAARPRSTGGSEGGSGDLSKKNPEDDGDFAGATGLDVQATGAKEATGECCDRNGEAGGDGRAARCVGVGAFLMLLGSITPVAADGEAAGERGVLGVAQPTRLGRADAAWPRNFRVGDMGPKRTGKIKGVKLSLQPALP